MAIEIHDVHTENMWYIAVESTGADATDEVIEGIKMSYIKQGFNKW